jgi:DNA polymerase I-like protein with 3'-5' exonuclease and polymerase domains
MIALDTETTGVDFRHGVKPFFVTICDDDGNQRFWEWDVNPFTRQPCVPPEDLEDLRNELELVRSWGEGFDDEIADRHCIIGQNMRFDVHALKTVGVVDFPWHRLHDTLIASHVLASNRPHNLTDLSMQYLGVDIEPKEKALEVACQEARRWCRSNLPDWAIAKEGRADMPSVKPGKSGGKRGTEKDKTWKSDMWLPRAVAMDQGFELPDEECDHLDRDGEPNWSADHRCRECRGHRWHLILRDYSNADSAVTVALWQVMREEIKRRKLWPIYLERMKALPIAWGMEDAGITLSSRRLADLRKEYTAESGRLERVCKTIASNRGYDLNLPANGRNQSLDEFVFNVMKMPVLVKTDTGAPSMDKKAIDGWEGLLPPTDQRHRFVKSMKNKRSRDTALTFLDSYERFWLPLVKTMDRLDHEETEYDEWRILHPNLNPTGTDTLRWTSSNPNSQQISKKEGFNLRYCFGPAPGREWWSMDAKNIELRIPAFESREQDLIDLLERMNDPPYYGSEHLLNFSTVYPDIWESAMRPGVTWEWEDEHHGKQIDLSLVGPYCKKKYAATWYQRCKNGDFAIGYGCGKMMADTTFQKDGAYDLLKARFAKKAALNAKCIEFAKKHGYVETIPDKSVDPTRGYPLLVSRSNRGEVIPTTPLNYHVSGTAMWWTMRAMIRVQAQLDEWRREDGFDGRIAMQVHDELVLDFPRGHDPVEEHARLGKDPKGFQRPDCNLWRIRVIQRLMEQGGRDIDIPTPVGIEYHSVSWSEGITF